MSTMKRVTVILSDEEYAEVRSKAGLIPLSAWFRSLALVGAESRRATGQGQVPMEVAARLPMTSAEMPTAPKPQKSKKTCPHGVEQGYNCWQCGGLAKVEGK